MKLRQVSYSTSKRLWNEAVLVMHLLTVNRAGSCAYISLLEKVCHSLVFDLLDVSGTHHHCNPLKVESIRRLCANMKITCFRLGDHMKHIFLNANYSCPQSSSSKESRKIWYSDDEPHRIGILEATKSSTLGSAYWNWSSCCSWPRRCRSSHCMRHPVVKSCYAVENFGTPRNQR